MDLNNCVNCTRKTACFNYLTGDELALFNANKTTIRYRKGETIVKQGTHFNQVISFNSGLAKLNIEIDNKRNLLIGLIKPSEILAGPGMFADNTYTFSVTALVDSTICLIDLDTFKKIFRTNEQFAESFMTSFSQRYIDTCKRFVSLTQKQMHGRMADGLLYLSKDFFQTDTFKLHLSRQEIADLTAMSKDSAIRILKDFERDKLIALKGNDLSILNMDQLMDISLKG